MEEGLSISGACLLVCLHYTMLYYCRKRDNTKVINQLREILEAEPDRGLNLHPFQILFFKFNNSIRTDKSSKNRKIFKVYTTKFCKNLY
jgi:hypothetical protein